MIHFYPRLESWAINNYIHYPRHYPEDEIFWPQGALAPRPQLLAYLLPNINFQISLKRNPTMPLNSFLLGQSIFYCTYSIKIWGLKPNLFQFFISWLQSGTMDKITWYFQILYLLTGGFCHNPARVFFLPWQGCNFDVLLNAITDWFRN